MITLFGIRNSYPSMELTAGPRANSWKGLFPPATGTQKEIQNHSNRDRRPLCKRARHFAPSRSQKHALPTQNKRKEINSSQTPRQNMPSTELVQPSFTSHLPNGPADTQFLTATHPQTAHSSSSPARAARRGPQAAAATATAASPRYSASLPLSPSPPPCLYLYHHRQTP